MSSARLLPSNALTAIRPLDHGEVGPLYGVLDVVADKWAILIVTSLTNGPLRSVTLVRLLPRISHKTLSQRLKLLERHGLIERRQYPTSPPKVTYALSGRGETLVGPATALRGWAEVPIMGIDRQASHHPIGVFA